jgi:Uma2 family endonuclease
MLTLHRSLSLTPDQFSEVCAANPAAVLELDAACYLIEMTPTGDATGARNTCLLNQLQIWARFCGSFKVFDSSTGYLLTDGFPPLCPDLVVELASPSDQPEALWLKMAS